MAFPVWIPLAAIVLSAGTVNAQSAVPLRLPPGPHPVGFRTVEITDPSRTFGQSVDEEGQPTALIGSRPLHAHLWYPAAAQPESARMRLRDYARLGAEPGDFAKPTEEERDVEEEVFIRGWVRLADTTRARRELDAPGLAVHNAADAPGRFPLIVYGPSFNAPAFENHRLLEWLASQGYVVISSPSWGADGGMTQDAAGLETQARDMEYLLASARGFPQADTRRAALMGFSWGGFASVAAALRNGSVRAVVSLDGTIRYFFGRYAGFPFFDPDRLTVPALFLNADGPTGAGLPPGLDSSFVFFESLRYSDATLVTFPKLRHQNFGLLFTALRDVGGPNLLADTAAATAGAEWIARYVAAFLDHALRGGEAGRAFLARAPEANGIPAGEATVERKRGARPLPTIPAFEAEVLRAGRELDAAAEVLAEIRRRQPGYTLPEADVNAWGYGLMEAGLMRDALGVLSLNAALHPGSANVHDSLGEAYAASGQFGLALESYQRALRIDPASENARSRASRLQRCMAGERAACPPVR